MKRFHTGVIAGKFYPPHRGHRFLIDTAVSRADRVTVMYGGTVVESGLAKDILSKSTEGKHPYSAALLASIPSAENISTKGDLPAIAGDVLDNRSTSPRGGGSIADATA